MFRPNAEIHFRSQQKLCQNWFNTSHFAKEDPVCTATCLALLYKMATRTTIHTTNAFVEGGKEPNPGNNQEARPQRVKILSDGAFLVLRKPAYFCKQPW